MHSRFQSTNITKKFTYSIIGLPIQIIEYIHIYSTNSRENMWIYFDSNSVSFSEAINVKMTNYGTCKLFFFTIIIVICNLYNNTNENIIRKLTTEKYYRWYVIFVFKLDFCIRHSKPAAWLISSLSVVQAVRVRISIKCSAKLIRKK